MVRLEHLSSRRRSGPTSSPTTASLCNRPGTSSYSPRKSAGLEHLTKLEPECPARAGVTAGGARRRQAGQRPAMAAGGSGSRDGSPTMAGTIRRAPGARRPRRCAAAPGPPARRPGQNRQAPPQDTADAVERELALDAHLQLAPSFSNSQAYMPPWVARRILMQGGDQVVRRLGGGRSEVGGDPTTAKRKSGPMRTAIMSFATWSPSAPRRRSVGDDVGQAVVDDELDLDSG